MRGRSLKTVCFINKMTQNDAFSVKTLTVTSFLTSLLANSTL